MKGEFCVATDGSVVYTDHRAMPSIKVLMYHRIVDDGSLAQRHWTCVHVNNLSQQLHMLDRCGFTTITFNDYRLSLSGELNLPRKPVVISFDDGYLDTYRLAFPVLRELGMKAVVFVVAGKNVKSNIWDRHLGVPPAPLLEPRHLVEMSGEGIEIGSHSLTHPRLTDLPDDAAWEELSHSKLLLEMLLDSAINSISYPYGLVNQNIKNMAREVGYTIGCGVSSGPVRFGDDLLEVRRTTIKNTTGPLRFGLRLLPFFQRYSFLRWKTSQALSSRATPARGRNLVDIAMSTVPGNGFDHET